MEYACTACSLSDHFSFEMRAHKTIAYTLTIHNSQFTVKARDILREPTLSIFLLHSSVMWFIQCYLFVHFLCLSIYTFYQVSQNSLSHINKFKCVSSVDPDHINCKIHRHIELNWEILFSIRKRIEVFIAICKAQ